MTNLLLTNNVNSKKQNIYKTTKRNCSFYKSLRPPCTRSDFATFKKLNQLVLIKEKMEGTSVCYCIHPENWKTMKTVMTDFLNQDLAGKKDCC